MMVTRGLSWLLLLMGTLSNNFSDARFGWKMNSKTTHIRLT